MVSASRGLYPRASRRRGSLTVLACAAVLAGCEPETGGEDTLVRPVHYTRVVAQGASETRTYSGTAHAELETDLSFRVGGTLIRRPVDVGSELGRGDPIAALDTSDFRVSLDEARAGLSRAEAERRNADANYERTRDLYENQNASRTELDTARAMAESAEAQYRAASQQVEAARLQLSYASLAAPEQCTVAQTFVEVNQNVSPGQPVVRLNCGRCAELVVSVPETEIARVENGMPVTAVVSAVPGSGLTGAVKEVGVATGAGATTYPVTVALEEGCELVRSGMTVDVRFDFPTTGPGENPIVPYVSVGEDRDGHFVFVIEPGAEDRLFAQRRSVDIGAVVTDGIVVTRGLNVGELIATAGVRRLVSGQEVTLLGEPSGPSR